MKGFSGISDDRELREVRAEEGEGRGVTRRRGDNRDGLKRFGRAKMPVRDRCSVF